MPLRLDFHHEVRKQKAIKRRDPLKLSGFGIVALAIFYAAYYVYELEESYRLRAHLASAQAAYAKLKPKADAAHERGEELSASIKDSATLVKRVEGRFYWAPVLATLSKAAPREVQITRMIGEVSGDSLKRCTLTIDGVAAGTDPRATAEALRKALGECFSERFKNVTANIKGDMEDDKEPAKLDGKELPAVVFTILLELQLGAEEPPVQTKPARAPRPPINENA